ncbi:hypothetical protein KIN20_027997 [Parelaphostrongylus tenuis]|uniref:CSD2 domain-containing protein n=1 Tax=Parelaphostrongylus tenuis TaxID=148309 RepID=A0AAD5R0I3_PARTN|nr:hypothetical protein KIN20_027997 [Parelaphostrongylus tenuis]
MFPFDHRPISTSSGHRMTPSSLTPHLPPSEAHRSACPNQYGCSPLYKNPAQVGRYYESTAVPTRRTVSISAPNCRPQNNYLPPRPNTSMSMYRQNSNHSTSLATNQKTWKPYFMPYLSVEAVTRGLASGDLVKGSLCVSKRSYEEAYVDNPDGDDQLDLLILGVHDRNRALHGDVVIVRIKERLKWVIRENLYQAWRAGHLHESREDNGQPITIPPVAAPKCDDFVEVPIGGLSHLLIRKAILNQTIPPSKDRKYGRQAMLIIGAQLEMARRECLSVQGSAFPIDHPSLPPVDVQKTIDSLSIGRMGDDNSLRYALRGLGNSRRVPPKTAEVMHISEMKNCRAAMGQLKMMTDGNSNWALFLPTDSRMPRMMISANQLPPGFFERPQDFAKFIFVARMVEWQATAQFPRGELERAIGVAGNVEKSEIRIESDSRIHQLEASRRINDSLTPSREQYKKDKISGDQLHRCVSYVCGITQAS